MYGAFIGDIVGSKYEFNNIKTKQFPLFSKDCDFTDDTIMTVAVAKAIMLSREEQFKTGGSGKGFGEYLVEVMQDYGRRFPDPTGAYGSRFSIWLRQSRPEPYNSYGNGSAMRVSPCGLAAVTLKEALALARVSASVSHNHPEGIKGAQAVAAAVFMAKQGRSKEEIRKYITEHYYDLVFTLNDIRATYSFDGSCQGSVPQAIVAFLESNSFEDAVRNVISIGGDTDTTGAITGSIAWTYYAVLKGGYSGWVNEDYDESMMRIKAQAKKYLPQEFIEIADEFHKVSCKRAGIYDMVGGCSPIINKKDIKQFLNDWGSGKEEKNPLNESVNSKGDKAAFAKSTGIKKVTGGKAYSLEYVKSRENTVPENRPGGRFSSYDSVLRRWKMRIQLDSERIWFLSVFLDNDGRFNKYSLDRELAEDSHYEFSDEVSIRNSLYKPGDEKMYFAEVLIRYIAEYGGEKLLRVIRPYITAEYHFD